MSLEGLNRDSARARQLSQGTFSLQSAFQLDGFQQDLFELDDDVDATSTSAPTIPQEGVKEASDALFALNDISPQFAIGNVHNPALRLLGSPSAVDLLQRDARDRESSTGSGPAEIEVLVALEAAGHALLVVSSIEREIRRCERAARDAVDSSSRDADIERAFLRALATAPPPAPIKEQGLRLTGTQFGRDRRLSVLLSEPGERYVSLERWPRFTIAFATSAIADSKFTFADSLSRSEVPLLQTRYKIISGGLPPEALHVRFRGSGGHFTTSA